MKQIPSSDNLLSQATDRLRDWLAALKNSLFPELHLAWLGLLSLALVLIGVVPHLGILRESAQIVIFPICLVCFWRLPKDNAIRLPAPLVLAAFCLWIGSMLNVRGVTPDRYGKSELFFSRLSEDSEGVLTSQSHKRYELIAQTYSLIAGRVVHRSFSDNDIARRWLKAHHPRSPLLLRGELEWMDIVF